jgi:hypothetical protein
VPNEPRGQRSNAPRSDAVGGVSIEELERALPIGQDLEQADREQAEAYWRVAKAAAIATSRRDAAYQNIKEVEASEDQKIRDSYGAEDKITEKAIESERRNSPAVRAAIREHLALAERAAVLGALTRSFEQRSYALKDLVQMFLRDFFTQQGTRSDPVADNIRRERHEERQRRSSRDEDDRDARERREGGRGRNRD